MGLCWAWEEKLVQVVASIHEGAIVHYHVLAIMLNHMVGYVPRFL